MVNKIRVHPNLKIKVIPDGEVHIVYELTLDHLAELARAFLAVSERKMKPADAEMAFRLKNVDAVDWLIQELTKAKKEMQK